MVDLYDEGDLVGVFAADAGEDAKRGGDRIAPAFDGELDDVLGVEVGRVLGEAGAGAVLDALVDGEDAEVAGVCEASVAVHGLEAAEDLVVAVGLGEDAVDPVAVGQVEVGLVDLAGVVEEGLGVGSQDFGCGRHSCILAGG